MKAFPALLVRELRELRFLFAASFGAMLALRIAAAALLPVDLLWEAVGGAVFAYVFAALAAAERFAADRRPATGAALAALPVPARARWWAKIAAIAAAAGLFAAAELAARAATHRGPDVGTLEFAGLAAVLPIAHLGALAPAAAFAAAIVGRELVALVAGVLLYEAAVWLPPAIGWTALGIERSRALFSLATTTCSVAFLAGSYAAFVHGPIHASTAGRRLGLGAAGALAILGLAGAGALAWAGARQGLEDEDAPVRFALCGLSPDGRRAVVAEEQRNARGRVRLLAIDLATERAQRLDVEDPRPRAYFELSGDGAVRVLTYDGRGRRSLARIDLATGLVLDGEDVPPRAPPPRVAVPETPRPLASADSAKLMSRHLGQSVCWPVRGAPDHLAVVLGTNTAVRVLDLAAGTDVEIDPNPLAPEDCQERLAGSASGAIALVTAAGHLRVLAPGAAAPLDIDLRRAD